MRNWPILVLALALVAALGWGYTRHAEANRLALRSENSYQQAFHRLDQSLSNIEDALGSALAVTNPLAHRRLFSDLRVYAATAVESLAGLPLLNVKLERTEHFLNSVQDTAERLERHVERGGRVGEADRRLLRELHSQAAFLKGEMARLGTLASGGRIRWLDTERVTHAGADGNGTTPLLQRISALEQGMAPPPGEEGAEALAGDLKMRPKAPLGPPISEAQARDIAARFLDIPPAGPAASVTRADGPVPVWLVSYTKANNVPVTVVVSVEGGHVLQMLDGRPVGSPTLSREQAIARARDFLAKNGHRETVLYAYDDYADAGAMAVVTLVPVENGLAIYHQRMKVRLALDNGEVIGYDAREYWMNRWERRMPAPRLSASEAAARLAPGLVVEDQRLGVVDVDGAERLVYRFKARLEGMRYEVYVDALTGEEVRVQRLEAEA